MAYRKAVGEQHPADSRGVQRVPASTSLVPDTLFSPDTFFAPNNATGINNATTLKATLAETTYLGELAQHTLDLPNNTRIHASVLNPALSPTTTIGDTLTISTNPEDVIVLPGR